MVEKKVREGKLMRDYFHGWYIKCQQDSHAVALIGAYHVRDRFSRASYRLMDHGRRVFDFESDMAAFEYEYPQ